MEPAAGIVPFFSLSLTLSLSLFLPLAFALALSLALALSSLFSLLLSLSLSLCLSLSVSLSVSLSRFRALSLRALSTLHSLLHLFLSPRSLSYVKNTQLEEHYKQLSEEARLLIQDVTLLTCKTLPSATSI